MVLQREFQIGFFQGKYKHGSFEGSTKWFCEGKYNMVL